MPAKLVLLALLDHQKNADIFRLNLAVRLARLLCDLFEHFTSALFPLKWRSCHVQCPFAMLFLHLPPPYIAFLRAP